jgi:glycine betaine/proline transport system ATP-binding protein
MGLAEAEEVARLAEGDDRGLQTAIDDDAPRVEPRTPLREILPLFIGDGDVPVAVVGERGDLEGVVVRGSLIAGLTTTVESPDEGGESLSGVGVRETSEVGPDGGEE